MDKDHIISVYENVSVLTGQMLAAASAGDWDGLVELEAHCQEQVQQLRQAAPAAALDASGRQKKIEIIKRILENDRQIRDLTMPWMAQLSALLNNSGTQRRLAGAYGAV